MIATGRSPGFGRSGFPPQIRSTSALMSWIGRMGRPTPFNASSKSCRLGFIAMPRSVTTTSISSPGPHSMERCCPWALTSYGMTVSAAVWVPPFKVAEMLTVAAVVTRRLVIVKPTEVAAAAIVTLAGTVVADVLLLDNLTLR